MPRVKRTDLIKQFPKIIIPQGEKQYTFNGKTINIEKPSGKKNELIDVIKSITGIKPLVNIKKDELSDLITGLFKERIERTKEEVKNFIDNRTSISGEEVVEFLGTDDFRYIQEISGEEYIIVIRINNSYYTITNEKIKTLRELIEDAAFEELQMLSVSDREILKALRDITNIDFIFRKKNNKYIRDGSGEFPYYNTTQINLAPLQIYTKQQFKNDPNTEIPCFIYCLQYFGIDEERINKVRHLMKKKEVPQKDLQQISILLNINIKLYKPKVQEKNNREITYYPKKIKLDTDETICICAYEGHYFPFIKNYYEISNYSIEHYEEVKHLDNFECIEGKTKDGNYQRRYKKKFYQDTFDLVDKMFKNNLFVRMGFDKYNYNSKITPEIINRELFEELDFGVDLGKEYEFFEKQTKNKIVYSFDFETITNQNEHIPYQVCFMNHETKDLFYYEGQYCARNMLIKLSELHNGEEIILYAHNAKYDLSFIFDYLVSDTFTGDTNVIYQYNGQFIYYENKIKIKIRDSFKLISKKLADFPKMFNLPIQKEVINYNFYTQENIEKRIHNVNDYCVGLSNKKKEQLIKNVNELNLLNENNEFDIVNYSRYYCEKDTEVLCNSLIIFRDWILEITGLDIYDYLTISSIAWNFVGKEGCLNGVYSLKGTPAQFIKNCVVGGRVMCANNEVICLTDKEYKISDFDAVGLYQSSMALGDGWLKGLPKVLKPEQLNKKFLDKTDGYFIKINLKKINIKRTFPLISIKENGIRIFTNDIENQEVFVDKYSFEDLIKFQDIEYDILQGYYYNEGRNTRIKEIQTLLYHERNKMKKIKNPIQEVYKLIGNSIYGKSIEKEHLKEFKIKTESFVWNYFDKNYKRVSEIKQLSNKKYLVVENKSLNDFSSYAHIGCEVLSFSKRIMNEVMCLAEDISIPIYYQDTDSMHIDFENIERLSQKYKETYNKELIGKGLGQFHTDFSSKKLEIDEKDEKLMNEVEEYKKNKATGTELEIYSTKSIFLGKKCYIDYITTDFHKEKNIYDYHIRYKGISNSCLLRKCLDEKITPLQLYDEIAKEEYYEIDLSKQLDEEDNKIDKKIFYFENFKVFTQDLNINPFTRTMKLKDVIIEKK